ncbi:MAG: response regulator, partial [Saprospiraceae bacterium]
MPKFRYAPILLLFLTFFLEVRLASAQNAAVQDSLNTRLQLLTQLSQASNFEQAQVEAEGFRDFLRRNRLPVPPKAVPVLSGIYQANEDDRSATRFLNEAQLDALHDPNPVTRAALLTVLVKECGRWELPELALNCQQQLSIAQDSMAARRRRAEALRMQQRLDSLVTLRRTEMADQARYMRLPLDQVYLLGGGLALLLLALLFNNYRIHDRWRKRMEKRELEMDLLQANLRHEAQETALSQSIEAVQQASIMGAHDPYTMYTGSKPEQIALLIEPNRQVVLYLKSLLSDRFQIETASTNNEGLQMASNLLPDLIVCDAVLNGKTGIDVARQIKLSERTNHIPVVLLTDRFGNEGKLDALRAGADAWFTRP